MPPAGVLAGAVRIAEVTLRVYRALQRSADLLAERFSIPAEAVARFGPLGLGLQVQGAIASHHAKHSGLRPDAEQRAGVVEACDAAVEANLRALCEDRAARGCVKRVRGQIKYTKDGSPYMELEQLRDRPAL